MLDQQTQRVVTRWLGGVSAFLVACAGPPEAHERDWIEAETPHFQIISTMSPQETSALAIDLERFRVVISKFTNAPLSDPPIPTRIFAFGKTSDFKRFTRSSNVAGWMAPKMRENLIALTDYRGVDSGQVNEALLNSKTKGEELLVRPDRAVALGKTLEVVAWLVPVLIERRGITYLDVTFISAVTGAALFSRRQTLARSDAAGEQRFPWEPRSED